MFDILFIPSHQPACSSDSWLMTFPLSSSWTTGTQAADTRAISVYWRYFFAVGVLNLSRKYSRLIHGSFLTMKSVTKSITLW